LKTSFYSKLHIKKSDLKYKEIYNNENMNGVIKIEVKEIPEEI